MSYNARYWIRLAILSLDLLIFILLTPDILFRATTLKPSASASIFIAMLVIGAFLMIGLFTDLRDHM